MTSEPLLYALVLGAHIFAMIFASSSGRYEAQDRRGLSFAAYCAAQGCTAVFYYSFSSILGGAE